PGVCEGWRRGDLRLTFDPTARLPRLARNDDMVKTIRLHNTGLTCRVIPNECEESQRTTG
ncbi:MAG TPA: hypothetical protein PLY86_21110, partial [bacterium]|nr:hypothetical protein [bacterium]